ncbi:TDP-N-acetylfucosamine:lipid II N-acetylfucosaminyltransferase [Aquella oligotrophica]|uniref:4-alpha-L-fucosyltransferase n=1 Tax=Aquella oligotrophica TaxID=2067065 RepID=A0A2I7N994_9NEIS|nr:TDP-N-acetylfucosamine:lipid II N-acetylfucosaminyltransferase [Aquella oligotrophica]AUR53023.1 hypothetical protein CUN60_12215 [Aquella oligotrophica]
MDKKILHLCSSSPITKSYIEFINENFGEENHFFVIFATSFVYEYPNNCMLITQNNGKFNYLKVLLMLNKATKIILHGFFYNRFITRLLTISPWNIKKCYWVIWGADLYDDTNQVSYTKTLKYRQFFFFKKLILKNIPYYVTNTENDYFLAKNFYNSDAQHIKCIMYTSNLYKDVKIPKVNAKTGTTKILLGNSASLANNHIETIDRLKPFVNNNILIYCPLSYGCQQNAKKVIGYGREIFKDKFVPMIDLLEENEYYKFLTTIDIAIFNHHRQEALANIINLLYFGKKVYINKNTIYDELVKQGIELFVINDGVDMLKITSTAAKHNSNIIKSYFNLDNLIKQHQRLFL